LVRKGNPKGIHTSAIGASRALDDPSRSNQFQAARMSILAMYGSELVKSQSKRAIQIARALYKLYRQSGVTLLRHRLPRAKPATTFELVMATR